MIELKENELFIRFPEVHANASCSIEFVRTLRIPDDDSEYPLPPGFEQFPLERVERRAAQIPTAWSEHGGIILPMYQAEAMWIRFRQGSYSYPLAYPFAIKIAAGKIDTITGEQWTTDHLAKPQNYVVVPGQPWLDGFCIRKGLIRQFVAMPLGKGYSAEEQISGAAEFGGLQIVAYPMKRSAYEEIVKREMERLEAAKNEPGIDLGDEFFGAVGGGSMGLAAGGLMRQEIYKDNYGLDVWDTSVSSRCFVHILNSEQWAKTTGKPPPGVPPSAQKYTEAGLPWFDYYADSIEALDGSGKLAALDSVAAKAIKLGEAVLDENVSFTVKNVVEISKDPAKVSDGKW